MRWKIVVFILLCLTIICTLVHSSTQSGFCSQTIQKDQKNQKKVKPEVFNGAINLTDWDFQRNGSVKLNGEWEFYWNQFLFPKDFKTDRSSSRTGFANVPGSWNYYQIGEESFAGQGYATYRLKVKLKKGKAYAVKILIMSTAYRVWVNGELLSVGKVGKSRQEMIPQFAVKTLRFVPEKSETEIVLQISNFFHRSGGPWRSIEIGTYQQIADQRTKSFAFDLFLIGAILMMGIYHLGLFVLRRKGITTLYFGLLCFVVVVRIFVTSEHVFYFLFPGFNWLTVYKFEYLSFYIGIPLAVIFINNLFPDESYKKTSEISLGISIVFSLIVLFTQPQVFSHTVVTYEIISLISSSYIMFIILRAVFKKHPGSILITVGSVIVIAALINDILYANEIIISTYLAPLGILFFILFHSLYLSMKSSKAFSNIKIIEAKMLEVQKMEAIGHLAESIAHDFNNIISAISSNTQVLVVNNDNTSDKKERRLQNIIDACDRATNLINQILTFSKKNKQESFKAIKLDAIIKEVTRFIRSTIPASIEIEQKINSQSSLVFSNSTQIYQIIMNLCYNAKDAMEKEGGILKVSLQPVELEGMKTTTGFLSKGRYVELIVSDTGEGMSPEVIKNMFDPYYTTKEQGKGTGLGLATVHGIVKSHGGEIEVKSKLGKGTTFRIYFPVTDKEEQAVEYGKEQNAITGQGKLLFVDDEAMIAETFDELLEAFGFDVDTYILPGQALKEFKENSYDVVLTDFQMPRMDGIEFIREIRKKDKNVKIIICSGNSSSISNKEYKDLDLYAIIQKPLDYNELTQIIQQAVDLK